MPRINNREREMWLDNDYGLYSAWKASGQSKRAFLRDNQGLIDGVITAKTGGTWR